jgi:hypothetical protein
LLVIVGIAWRLCSSSASEAQASVYHEPDALADRAAAFSLAWICKDLATMSRFTAASESAAFADWLRFATGQLPVTLEDVAPSEVEAKVTATAPEKDPRQAIITVSFEPRGGAPPPKSDARFTHRQAWSEVDGKWIFLPEETLRLLRSPRTSPWK